MSKRLIYEEDAIEWVENILEVDKYYHPHAKSRNVPIDEVIDRLKRVPSAQPQRMRGEWIEDGYNHYKAVCSECGEPCATYIMGKPRDKYCKWCGADMRGEEDETD